MGTSIDHTDEGEEECRHQAVREHLQDSTCAGSLGHHEDGEGKGRPFLIPDPAVVAGDNLKTVVSGRQLVQGQEVLVSQILPFRAQPFQAVRVPDFVRGAVAEGREGDPDVPHPPGKDDVVFPAGLEDILGNAGPGALEAGENHRRGHRVGLDGAGIEGDEAVGRAQVDAAVPGDQAGVQGEQAGLEAVAGAERLLAAVVRGIADDAGIRGRPQLLAVEEDFLDVAVQEGFRALFAEQGESFPGSDINAVTTGSRQRRPGCPSPSRPFAPG